MAYSEATDKVYFPILELLVEQLSGIQQGADRDSSISVGSGRFAVILICCCMAEVVLAESVLAESCFFWKENKSQPKVPGVKAQEWRENEVAALQRVVCHGPEQCLILGNDGEGAAEPLALPLGGLCCSAFPPHSRTDRPWKRGGAASKITLIRS